MVIPRYVRDTEDVLEAEAMLLEDEPLTLEETDEVEFALIEELWLPKVRDVTKVSLR